MENVKVDIIDYTPVHQPIFEKLNRQWIEQFFWMEPVDFEVLQKPDEHIIAKGGAILMAVANGKVAGTVALKLSAPGIYEFTKMAVDEADRGKQIGKKLGLAAIEKAARLGASKIILYSNTILAPAIELYKKLGFKEVTVDGPYKRSNIKMELTLQNEKKVNSILISMRTASRSDVWTLVSLGKETFRETFASSNSEADMSIYLEENFNEKILSAELADNSNTFFLAEIEGTPIAYAKISRSVAPEQLKSCRPIELSRLYARSEVIGRGVGQALMQKCLEYARTNGCDVIWLGVWEHNKRALSFYYNFGFEQFGQHVFMLGKDAQTDLLLMKQLEK